MLDLVAIRKNFNRADAMRKAGALAPAFLRIELRVRKYGALTCDHLVEP
jgi:hypothetical protein